MVSGREDFDLVVIGAGGCGMVAALIAAELDATVALLEKTDKWGGGTALSTRGLRAAGTRFQNQAGVSDSPEQYARDILQRNKNQGDPVLTELLTRTSVEVVHWLADKVGVPFRVREFQFGHSERRSHYWDIDKPITDFLYEAVEREPKIKTFFSTAVRSLLVDEAGAVAGVVTDSGTISGRRVVLATGGFGASPELRARYLPHTVGIPFPGHPGSTGDGLQWALELGAVIDHMDAFQPYPAYLDADNHVPPEITMSGGILVGPDGKRFTNETEYPGGLSEGILGIPDKHAYVVFDDQLLNAWRNTVPFDSDLMVKADSPAQLAELLGIDRAGLEYTIHEYNATKGKKDKFGRTIVVQLVPPFYGIRVTVALYHTQGGIRVNDKAQVIRGDGSVIPGLYAGGGVAAGVSGNGMTGYLPGNGQLASLGLGFIAGRNAVLSLQRV